MEISKRDVEKKARELFGEAQDWSTARTALAAYAEQDAVWAMSRRISGWAFWKTINQALLDAGFRDSSDENVAEILFGMIQR